MYSNLYILFGFMGFVIGFFVLFFTINVSKARLGTRNNAKIYAIDLPPRYSEVEPPPYDWVLKHRNHEDFPSEMLINLSATALLCAVA